MTNEELLAALRTTLADTFIMYFQTHSAHWNVQGNSFLEYHNFFGSLYEELHDAVDSLAEQIRVIDAPAPVSLSELWEYKTVIENDDLITDGQALCQKLLLSNAHVIADLNRTFSSASASNNQALVNFVAARLETHAKHNWMLRSHTINSNSTNNTA